DLRENVSWQVSLEIQVLDERQGIREGLAGEVVMKNLAAPITLQLRLEPISEQARAQRLGRDGHAVQVGHNRAAREGFEGCLGSEHTWSPIELWIPTSERPEDRTARERRHPLPNGLFRCK